MRADTDAEATPLSTYRRNACSVPMPAGVIGKSVATLDDTCTRPAFSSDWGMLNASSRNQIVTKRSPQSAACHVTTRPR